LVQPTNLKSGRAEGRRKAVKRLFDKGGAVRGETVPVAAAASDVMPNDEADRAAHYLKRCVSGRNAAW
jgi:hypothetical protein